jgi:hypothetical protein
VGGGGRARKEEKAAMVGWVLSLAEVGSVAWCGWGGGRERREERSAGIYPSKQGVPALDLGRVAGAESRPDCPPLHYEHSQNDKKLQAGFSLSNLFRFCFFLAQYEEAKEEKKNLFEIQTR